MSEAKELDPAHYDRVIEAMKEIIDPEIGVNIIDLGLVYGLQESEDGALLINMTLTSAGCPLQDVIEEQTAEALDSVVDAFRINWVWMPPWGPEQITEDGKEMMRAIGFSI
ncbi:MAG: metal-sulfur cluster assembly factor [Micrococcales bacterium]|jgi:metal-sulfur cluster biosynthetic enzyme|nr:metal-sulfur cluster assembly factor [Aquiluna sp.]MBT5088476.1 metal-sulfur cluster assembly factor [Micrococcales bacterium]MBT5397631.1 metal-sulfur cluster assembly factor [Micrococcales bacterium]MBT5432005.1 metal-sulfur cluster assembly factor [Micrococcales bacterium]MBT5847530.1 metal-sulfur cluster assembly factor [Micrococcales bacterium]MBT7926547.1 metal-sulfur cluster assembly factor [Micrococcales bacterium]